MSKTYLYIRGRAKEAQQTKLKEEYPQGELVIDRRPPETLERLIAEAGPGDLIAAVNIYDLPGISAETYKTICGKGAALHFQQQPHLDSAVFSGSLAGEATEAATAAAILQRQLDIEAARQAQQREKEKAGRGAAAAAGRTGGRRAGDKQKAKKEGRFKALIREMQAQGMTNAQIVEELKEEKNPERHLSHNTTYKYIRELEAQDAQEAGPGTGKP